MSDLGSARNALRGWIAEDAEGRVMTVVEDPSIVDFITEVMNDHDRLVEAAREVLDYEHQPTRAALSNLREAMDERPR